jgi:hypothetical protein
MSEHSQCTPALPNWAVITAPAARQALEGIIRSGNQSRFDGLTPRAAVVLAVILRHYAAEARPPTLNEIGVATKMTADLIRNSLDLLRRLDFVIVDRNNEMIQGAYPFTERATGHKVTFSRSGRTVKAMCVIDALGAGAMCGENVSIVSACGLCGLSISGNIKDSGMTLSAITPSSSVVWVCLRSSPECAADTFCTEVLFFCGSEHLEQWLLTRDRRVGYRLSPEEAFQVGKALFIDRAMLYQF